MHHPLKLKAVFVAKMFTDLSPSVEEVLNFFYQINVLTKFSFTAQIVY